MNSIKNIFQNDKTINSHVKINGWVTSFRFSKNVAFFEVNDGSHFKSLHIVCKNNIFNFNDLKLIRLGASIEAEGTLIKTENREQNVELQVAKIHLINNTSELYPLQKKSSTREFLREIQHFRHQTNLFRAIMRIRSSLALSIHEYFNNEGFLYFASPIITSNDGEGAGEAFEMATLNGKEFFGIKATLGVTGQLQAESYANGFGKVYTFAPTFRAEKSHTQKHLAEFWMVEPEVCFFDLNKIIELAENLLKFVVEKTLKNNLDELEFLESQNQVKLIERLKKFVNSKLIRINYEDAITILLKSKHKFEEKNIFFGMDLKTEHERFLAENHFLAPVVVMNYPKDIKAFYMYQNDDNKTVKSFDMLIPGVGELIGGSQRENRYEKLIKRMKELNMPIDGLNWYLEIRKEGYPGSSGFGIGFERLIMYITGVDNIRDTIPFPRAHNSIFA